MSDDIDRSDELREWFAEDQLREFMIRNGAHPDDPGATQPPDDDDPGHIEHTAHLRVAYELAGRYKNKLLHVHGIGWHRWDGKRWAYDDGGAAKRAVYATLKVLWAKAFKLDGDDRKSLLKTIVQCETAGGVTGVLTLAGALIEFAATTRDLDADPWLLNCANGTLDLHTMRSRPHKPADRITKICRGAYLPDTPTPVWDKFLHKVLPDEAVRGFVQRLAGLALLGTVREHLLPIFTGIGANGKSTLYNALLHTLNDYGHAAEPGLFMHHDSAHPTGQMDLFGRRLVIVSESDQGRHLAEATMKRLTGGDPITARYMRQDFVQFTPSHLAVMVTNHLPVVRGDDPAIWRRIRVVPFDVVIPDDEQDNELDAKLALEADGILTWALAGWVDYLKHGLAEPDSVRAATDKYQRRSDDVGRFIDECCYVSPAVKATTQDLFSAWCRWREADGAAEIGRREFGKSLDDRGYPAQQPKEGKRWRLGIGVREVSADE